MTLLKWKGIGRLDVAYCFYAKIGSETDDFDIADVCNEICELIHRHPHIYGDTVVKDEEVKQN
jgi:XTP/dITP diphosphohydrolase